MQHPDPTGDEIEVLVGGWQTTVHRVGHDIRRSRTICDSVIDLLSHLEERGFAGSPRPVGSGFDADGHELLTFVEGESPQPRPWSDDAIVRLDELLASSHAASFSMRTTCLRRTDPGFVDKLVEDRRRGDQRAYDLILLRSPPGG